MANGTPVAAGRQIGTVGSTGNSTGPHLHYEQRLNGTPQHITFSGQAIAYTGGGVNYTSQNCPGANPIGAFDQIVSSEAGRIRVRGWAFDPDAPTQPISIHVYVGGPVGAPGAEGHDLGHANLSRPDVAQAHPSAGPNHGYDRTFTTNKVGNVPVYVYAINRPGTGGTNTQIGARTTTVRDPSPLGNVDELSSPVGGTIRARGWAFDLSAPTAPVGIHVYVGGPAGSAGAEGHNLGIADLSRPDVASAHPTVGPNHGFDRRITTGKRGTQPVYVYAINLAGTPGSNRLIGSRSVTINAPPPHRPFSSWGALVTQHYRDFAGRAPTAAELSSTTADLAAGRQTPAGLTTWLMGRAAHWQPVPQVTRLYQAYFLRLPDHSGLTYWANQVRSGVSLQRVSQSFAGSAEFRNRYGSLTNRQFVDLIYRNILGRPGDANGVAFWTNELNSGRRTRGAVMTGFSESAEYKTKTAARVNVVSVYAGMLRRVPTTAELTADSAKNLTTVIDTIRHSTSYANRIN